MDGSTCSIVIRLLSRTNSQSTQVSSILLVSYPTSDITRRDLLYPTLDSRRPVCLRLYSSPPSWTTSSRPRLRIPDIPGDRRPLLKATLDSLYLRLGRARFSFSGWDRTNKESETNTTSLTRSLGWVDMNRGKGLPYSRPLPIYFPSSDPEE